MATTFICYLFTIDLLSFPETSIVKANLPTEHVDIGRLVCLRRKSE